MGYDLNGNRREMFLLGALVLTLLFGLVACTPAEASPLSSITVQSTDSLRVRPAFRLLPPVDSAHVTVTVSGVSKRVKVGPQAVGSVHSFAAPAEGSSVTISVSLVSFNGNAPSAVASSSKVYTRPFGTPPTPIIDSITVDIVIATLGTASYVSDVAIISSPDTCQAEWAELPLDSRSQPFLVVRAKGTPPAWCHSYLYSDTLTATQAKWNWMAVRWHLAA